MIDASCHCGAIRFTLEAAPAEVNECDCSICRRYGALWAYYALSHVRFAPDCGPTDVYMWGARRLQFHRCASCGCVTHWRAVDENRPVMGINTRMMPPGALTDARVLHNGERR
jgi:hypothetical protein